LIWIHIKHIFGIQKLKVGNMAANNKIKLKQIDELELAEFVQQEGANLGLVQLACGHGAPVSPPQDPTQAALYYDLDTFQMSFWNPETQSW
jgi:hypothetical protein